MKSKKNKKKILPGIIAIIIIILIILISIFIVLFNKNKTDDNAEENYVMSSTKYDLPTISYSNYIDDVYEGKVKTTYSISNTIEIAFETYLPMINDDIIGKTEDELKEYFYKDEERILYNLGIDNEEDFVNFANNLQDIGNLSDFDTLTYIEGSYEDLESYETIEFQITYENASITCKAYIYSTEGVLSKMILEIL